MHGDLIYLACPYTEGEATARKKWERFDAVNAVAGRLFRQGRMVFSPISHCHMIALTNKLPDDFEFWREYDRTMISKCDRMMVLKLDGWETSTGVWAEIDIANEYGIPVEYVTLEDFGIDPPCGEPTE